MALQAGRTGGLRSRVGKLSALAALTVVAGLGSAVAAGSAQAATGNKVDLKVLLVDDGGGMVGALGDALTSEGVPHTTISLADAGRPTINAAYLSSGTEAFYQAVVLPNELGGSLTSAELTALHTYEVAFGIRQVDAYTWAQPTLGLNYAAAPNGSIGSTDGLTATVTTDGKANGWGYLNGSVPFSTGSYAYIATPLATQAAGATFTPFVTAPITGGTGSGSLIGAYSSGGLEQLVITTNYLSSQQHFRTLAHGIISWMTRGVHLGYNRSYFTMHFDDAFSADARWSSTAHCTPGEDCPTGTPATTDIRMTPADVTAVANWVAANGYTPTLAFNAHYAVNDPATDTPYTTPDPLTTALVASKASFNWLDHGFQHIFQGCQQDFTVIPWRCVTTPAGAAPAADGSNITWVSLADINAEIQQNVAEGKALGLPFDTTEYLSGEHSGLYRTPQQPVDNPNFAAALTANGIKYIGADASREPAQRPVGSAVTIPRHPVAVYYNVSTMADEVSEYNWFYATPANGGNCNTATTACMSGSLDPATGFTGYIVPTDTAWDLHYMLANDPRPFYAHVSNLTGPDYLGLTLMSSILNTYKGSFAANAPLVNQTETRAANVLGQQQAWATGQSSVTASVSGTKVTVSNPNGIATPITVPAGTLQGTAAFGTSYGGEQSAWKTGSPNLTLPTTPYGAASPSFTTASPLPAATVGKAYTTTIAVAASPVPAITTTSTLPTGLTFKDNGNGSATISGTPATGTGKAYSIALTATNVLGTASKTYSLTANQPPAISGATNVTLTHGVAKTVSVTITGYPTPSYTVTGTIPPGMTLTKGTSKATISGTPTTVGSYPITVSATNTAGTATATFTITVV